MAPRTRRSEIGSVGLPLFAGYLSLDPNRNLRGAQAAQIYRQMRLDDPAIAAFLNATYNILRTDLIVAPGGTRESDKRAAAFVETCLDDMSASIGTLMRQAYTFIWAGWGIQEIVYKRRMGGANSNYADGRIGWRDWGLRRQETLYRWGYDIRNGAVYEFQQRPPPDYRLRYIPLSKCLHVVADETDGSPEGLSALRAGYRQYYIVSQIELLLGITLERGAGIPVFEIDAAAQTALTADDKALIERIASDLRQNEAAYVITPPAVKFRFAELPGVNASSYLDTIQRMRGWMLASVLADFIGLGLGDRGGAYALSADKSELFLLALNGYQDRLLDAINRQAVARLMRYNDFGPLTSLPRLTLPSVKRYDLEKLGSFLSVLNTVGVWTPRPEDELFLRKVADIPEYQPPPSEPPDAAPATPNPDRPSDPSEESGAAANSDRTPFDDEQEDDRDDVPPA